MMTEKELLYMVGLTHKNMEALETHNEMLYWRVFASKDNTYPIFIHDVLWVNGNFLIKTDEYKWGWHAEIVHGNYRGAEHFSSAVSKRFESLLDFDQHLWRPQDKMLVMTDNLRSRCFNAFPETWRRTLPPHLAEREPGEIIASLLAEIARAYYWLDNADITQHDREYFAREVTLRPYLYLPYLVDIENEIRAEEEELKGEDS